MLQLRLLLLLYQLLHRRAPQNTLQFCLRIPARPEVFTRTQSVEGSIRGGGVSLAAVIYETFQAARVPPDLRFRMHGKIHFPFSVQSIHVHAVLLLKLVNSKNKQQRYAMGAPELGLARTFSSASCTTAMTVCRSSICASRCSTNVRTSASQASSTPSTSTVSRSSSSRLTLDRKSDSGTSSSASCATKCEKTRFLARFALLPYTQPAGDRAALQTRACSSESSCSQKRRKESSCATSFRLVEGDSNANNAATSRTSPVGCTAACSAISASRNTKGRRELRDFFL